jgi:cystathionine beta-lyase/cystathionine gamma-synthase
VPDDPATRLVHAGLDREDGASSAPPIVTGSFFTSSGSPEELAYSYTRHGNPTWEALEEALGALEDATALVFASGQAAELALVLALTEERPQLVMPSDGYFGMRTLATLLAGRLLDPVPVDLQDLGAVREAVGSAPSVLWAETPTNPLLRVMDLDALSQIASEAGAPMVVDNTVATAILQRPLEQGAIATLTSLTKIASGHSDLLLGAVATRDEELVRRLRAWRGAGGGIAGPFEAWLAHRGIRTLALRIERQSATALALAHYLQGHERVRAVHYPGLDGPDHAVAARQMRGGFGPLLSFELDGDAAATEAVVGGARLIRPGTSFGGIESSWERRARWPEERAPESLIRMSAGIEAAEDLLADLDAALAIEPAVAAGRPRVHSSR